MSNTIFFDKNPIYNIKLESYIGYGKNDISEMNKNDIEKELKRIDEEIENLNEELNDIGNSFSIKEQILNLKDYKKKLKKALNNF